MQYFSEPRPWRTQKGARTPFHGKGRWDAHGGLVTNFRSSSYRNSRRVADTATLRESAGVGFWIHLIDVRHSLIDSAMERLHLREVAIKELGTAKADEKFLDKAAGVGRVCG